MFRCCFFFLICCVTSLADKNAEREVRKLKQQIQLLKQQNQTTNSALVAAKKKQLDSAAKVKELTLRLQALGLHDGGIEERLLQAVSDAQALHQRLTVLQSAAEKAQIAFSDFVKIARTDNADQRIAVQVALKRLDQVLNGLDEKPQAVPKQQGTLDNAKIMSVDAKSGVVVLNVGSQRDAKIGMTFIITRGGRKIGEVMVAEVRQHICGTLITVLSNANEDVRFGDQASIKIQGR